MITELEDEAIDVVRKAARGLGQPVPETLGDLDEHAQALGLHPEKLRHLNNYLPDVALPTGIHQIVTKWGHIGVNSWLIEWNGTRLLFDTGTDGEVVKRAINGPLDALFITHNHVDHVGGMNVFADYAGPLYAAADCGFHTAWSAPGDLSIGPLDIRVLDVTGHATPSGSPVGLAYHFEFAGQSVCVVGDALFAGSMGGCITPARYQMALEALDLLRRELPRDTIILPGHGRATTMASELANNPFYTIDS